MNPSQLSAFETRAAGARLSLFGDAVTIGGASYQASVTLSASQVEAGADGGPVPVQTLSAEISKASLTTAPYKGMAVAYNGKNYTILEVHGDEATCPAWLIRAYRRLQ